MADLTKGGFQEVIDDPSVSVAIVTRVLFCQGKIYYDLLEKKEELKAVDTAIVRIEQLHPLPEKQIKKVLAKYKNAKEHFWVQEEPLNMGAWAYMLMNFTGAKLEPITRKPSGAPATGSSERSKSQQAYILNKAFLSSKFNTFKPKAKSKSRSQATT